MRYLFSDECLALFKRGVIPFFAEVSIIVISLKVFTYEVGQALQRSEFELDFFHFSG